MSEEPIQTVIDLTQTTFANLGAHLLDLLHVLEGKNIPIILVGGFGLFLRQERVRLTEIETQYEYIPPARATDDFDTLLMLELMADIARVEQLREALDDLKYEIVPGAENYQFLKKGSAAGTHRDIKIDLLARLPDAEFPTLRADARRVKPREKNSPLHARRTDEAFAAEEAPAPIGLKGVRTDGSEYEAQLLLPNPYSLFLMKLFAFRDEEENRKKRLNGANQKYSRKHAGDLYRLAATLSREEDSQIAAFRARHTENPLAKEASKIVQFYFSDVTAAGILRLIEELGDLDVLPDFIDFLVETFLLTDDTQPPALEEGA